jgi:hypothetical protein
MKKLIVLLVVIAAARAAAEAPTEDHAKNAALGVAAYGCTAGAIYIVSDAAFGSRPSAVGVAVASVAAASAAGYALEKTQCHYTPEDVRFRLYGAAAVAHVALVAVTSRLAIRPYNAGVVAEYSF